LTECVDSDVDEGGDVGPGGLVPEIRPTGFGWNPENALGGVFVAVFEEGVLLIASDAFGFEFRF